MQFRIPNYIIPNYNYTQKFYTKLHNAIFNYTNFLVIVNLLIFCHNERKKHQINNRATMSSERMNDLAILNIYDEADEEEEGISLLVDKFILRNPQRKTIFYSK